EKWLDITTYHQEENNSQACLKTLKEKGYTIVATSPGVKQFSPTNLPLDKPIALFFGGERDGLSSTILEQADAQLCIPMVGFTESFNISVSAAITLYELTNRLKRDTTDWKLRPEDQLALRIKWATQTIPHGEKLVKKFYDDRS
ncbi:MAG: TrmH family RNA methyltransferase, partial [Bacteroidota bacterium]